MSKVAELMFKPHEHMFTAFEYKIYLVVNKNPPSRKIKSIEGEKENFSLYKKNSHRVLSLCEPYNFCITIHKTFALKHFEDSLSHYQKDL